MSSQYDKAYVLIEDRLDRSSVIRGVFWKEDDAARRMDEIIKEELNNADNFYISEEFIY